MTEFEFSVLASRAVYVEADTVEEARELAELELVGTGSPWSVEQMTVTGEKLGDEWVEVEDDESE